MKYLWKYAKRYFINIVVAAIASVGCSVATVMVIDVLKKIIDATVNQRLDEVILELLIRVAVVVALGMLSNYLVVSMTGRFGAGVLKDIRKDAIDAVMKTSPDFMERHNFGDIMERLSSDVEGIAGYMQTYFKDCIYVPVIVVVYSVYLLNQNLMLALCCLIPLGILVPISIAMLGPVKKSQFKYTKMLGLTNNNIQEVFDGVDVVKSYNLQERLKDKYYKDLKATLDLANRNDIRQYNVGPINMLIVMLPTVIAMCVGGFLVFEGQITIGIMVAFISTLEKLIGPLENAYQLVVRTQMAMISVDRVMYCMEMPVENSIENEPYIQRDSSVIFRFENVGFSYEGSENKVLTDINLSINKGQRIAFVGRSGSGKSTLIKLLCRQYEATQGDIYFYNAKFGEINPQTLRKDIALISQDSVIFPMSVADNIRIGNPDAGDEQIKAAAIAAGCDEFIQSMPKGYDSMLEEKGANLSGGQRQRISIARAILKNSNVLLLDEPTSALDRETEALICKTLTDVSEGKTVITVAHRLTTIMDYDLICVVEAGKIIEQGNHSQLMNMKGRYYDMFAEYSAGGDY